MVTGEKDILPNIAKYYYYYTINFNFIFSTSYMLPLPIGQSLGYVE